MMVDIISVELKWMGELTPRTSTDFEIIHHAKALSCTIFDIHRWHIERGFKGIGYNWFVRKDGSVYEGRPEWASDADAQGYNHNSLSTCLEGDFTQEQLLPMQRKGLVNLMTRNRLKYPYIKSTRHKDVSDTDCPGDIPFADILAEVEENVRKHKEAKSESVHEKIKELEKNLGILQENYKHTQKQVKEIKSILDTKLDTRIR